MSENVEIDVSRHMIKKLLTDQEIWRDSKCMLV